MNENKYFRDILEPRSEIKIFKMMTRVFEPQKSHVMDKYFSPQELKDLVSKSIYLDAIIESVSASSDVSIVKLKGEIQNFLNEMGFDHKLPVIRWMGIVFLKICCMMKIGIFVNETAVFKLKDTMKNNPVLFLPTHRSYADFCLMTYLCYHYNIYLPAVAAGMDFYHMAVIGRRMRETGAFYIRRTLAGDSLYAATLRQYVRTIVEKHCAPIEFFLEGTRSRSNKSMAPKYGMLSMALLPYFARDVSDITIVPVNISYDRLMEHSLFAYEHLGVPKPKESTGGFLKALRSLNDHFGNIYISLGSPLSVREYLQDELLNPSAIPSGLQELTQEQFLKVQNIANHVISLQQNNTVVTISNLISVVLMQSLVNRNILSYAEVLTQLEWTIGVLKILGATVFENDVPSNLDRIMVVHRSMMKFDQEKKLRLVSGGLMDVSEDIKKKMKGHILNAETMVNAVPIIQLQLYVNPVLHYLVPPAIISLLVRRAPVTYSQLFEDYSEIRKLLRYEFFNVESNEGTVFNKSLQYCIQNEIIRKTEETFTTGADDKLQNLLKWSIFPALATLYVCTETMYKQGKCDHKQALALIQARVEQFRSHPYCLSLEAIGNCLQGLTLNGALRKNRSQTDVSYELVPDIMEKTSQLIKSILPTNPVDFGRNNPVVLDFRTLSRL